MNDNGKDGRQVAMGGRRAKSNRVSHHVRCPSLPACGLLNPPPSSAHISLLATWVPPSAARLGSALPNPSGSPIASLLTWKMDARVITAKASPCPSAWLLAAPTCLQDVRPNPIYVSWPARRRPSIEGLPSIGTSSG